MRPARDGTILISLALGVAACGSHGTPKAPRTAAGPGKDVRTAAVLRTGGAGTVAAPATVLARQRAALCARLPASVVELPYQEGQWVPAGAVVVRLDDAALRAAVAAAEAETRAAEADLERTKTLIEKGVVAPRALEQVTAAASGARAELTAARDTLSYAALRAPFAGRVAARRANLGDIVNAGTPLIEIEGEGGLELRATVESDVAATLRPGASVEAVVDGQPEPLTATVTAVAPSGDPTTNRVEVKANLPAAAGLRAGFFARLLVRGVTADPHLTVPATALFKRGGLVGLFVVSEGRARLRWVAIGARDAVTVEVRAGVEAGERVALDPAGLADGTLVNEQRSASDAGFAPAEREGR